MQLITLCVPHAAVAKTKRHACVCSPFPPFSLYHVQVFFLLKYADVSKCAEPKTSYMPVVAWKVSLVCLLIKLI